jgi:multidrug efflux pump subunit AcrB
LTGENASEMESQVEDKIENMLLEMPYVDRFESYSQPG